MTIATCTLKSATTNAAAPFSFGHSFKKGDVPAGSNLVSGLSDMQVVAKSTWPDGSLKFAILSGRASLVTNTVLPVVLSLGTPAAGTVLTTVDLKTTGITASIDCGAFGSVSWATTDWDTPFQTWVSGPKMSSWVYRKPVGSDPHLVAWLEVRMWSGGEVEVLPWIENGYLLVTGPTNKSATYTFTLGGSQRFTSALDLKHHSRTPLVSGTALSYWLAVDPGVTPMLDSDYLQATEMVPSYAPRTAVGGISAAMMSTFTPLAPGSLVYDGDYMPSSGYQRPIGLLPMHDVVYLVGTDQPELRYGTVVRAGYAAGRYSIHYRDETTNRPLRFSSHLTRVISNGSGMSDTGASTTSSVTPTTSGGSTATWDTAHSPSVGFMAYLVTGHWYHMETSLFAATASWLNINDANNRVGSGIRGRFYCDYGAVQTRAAAWGYRAAAQALAIIPDADTTLRTEFINLLELIIGTYHGIYVGHANNPFGIIEPGEEYSPPAGVDGQQHLAIWQQDFFTAAYGYSQALDLPLSSTVKTKLAAFFQWKAKSVVGRLGATGDPTGFDFRNADVYTMSIGTNLPNYFAGTGPWLADWKAIETSTFLTPPSPDWRSTTANTLAGEYDPTEWVISMWGQIHAALAYAVRYAVPGADTAYARVTGAANYSALQSAQAVKPVWAYKPATITQEAPSMGLGKVVRVDTSDYINGVTVCGDTGFGMLASELPVGFPLPGLLNNDVDVNDPVGTVYRATMASAMSVGTLVLNEDGSLGWTPPNGYIGTATGTVHVWKNNEIVYDTALSFTSGAGGVTLTGSNCVGAHTSSVGAIILGVVHNLTGSNCTAAHSSSTGAIVISGVHNLTGSNCVSAHTSSTGVVVVDIPGSGVHTLSGSNCTQVNQSSVGAVISLLPDGFVYGILYLAPGASMTEFTLKGGLPYIPKHPLSEMFYGVDLTDWLTLRQTTLVSVAAESVGIEIMGDPFIQGSTVLAKFGVMDTSDCGVNSCTFLFTCEDTEVGAMTIYFDVAG